MGYGGIYRWSEWAPSLIWGSNSPNPGWPAVHVADRPPNSASTDFAHRIPRAPTLLNTLAKQKLKWRQHLASQPHFGSVGPGLCAMSSPHVILSVTMPYFGYIEDMHGFWFIWCFSSSDVPEMVDQQNSCNTLVINTYLLYLAWSVGILVVNICILWLPTPPHLELCSSLSKEKN
jgi:hypothetical protein